MSNTELAVQFFLQIAVILFVCRCVGIVAAKFGQPQVVAEMIAGVLLGPSLFGLLAPEIQQAIFPWDSTQKTRDSQSYLFPASQLGLALYMFIVGMEFRIDVLKAHAKCSIAVSIAGMAVPFVLGAGLAAYFFYQTELFPAKTTLSEAMLFLGASMCITAFPMLARIIHHKGLAGTLMGTVALGAGAIDDVTAWCLLAVVLASFDDNTARAVYSIGGGVAFVAAAVFVLGPVLHRLQHKLVDAKNQLNDAGLTVGLGCMALGAWFTDLIHLHAVFGAFVVGTMIPRGAITKGLSAKIQPLAVSLLLPLFFTYSGLNTKIGLLNSWYLWGMCLLVLLMAVLGKGVACTIAAKMSGLTTRESLGIGTLMNARGLMELIIINIGLQRGIISEGLFATLVIMAIITTLMASPIFDLVIGKSLPAVDPRDDDSAPTMAS
jgi:Kef-type K+ transport system membrane component KefB